MNKICGKAWAENQNVVSVRWYRRINAYVLRPRTFQTLEFSHATEKVSSQLRDLGYELGFQYHTVMKFERWVSSDGITTASIDIGGESSRDEVMFETRFEDGSSVFHAHNTMPTIQQNEDSVYGSYPFGDVTRGHAIHRTEVDNKLKSGLAAVEQRSEEQTRAVVEWYNRARSSFLMAVVPLVLVVTAVTTIGVMAFKLFGA